MCVYVRVCVCACVYVCVCMCYFTNLTVYVRRIRDKYEKEIEELEKSERQTREKYNTTKVCVVQCIHYHLEILTYEVTNLLTLNL